MDYLLGSYIDEKTEIFKKRYKEGPRAAGAFRMDALLHLSTKPIPSRPHS